MAPLENYPLLHQVLKTAGLAVFHTLWSGCLVLLLLIVILKIIPASRAKARFAVSWTALQLLLLLFVAVFFQQWKETVISTEPSAPLVNVAPTPVPLNPNTVALPTEPTVADPIASPTLAVSWRAVLHQWAPVGAALWLLGCLLHVARLVNGLWYTQQLKARSQFLSDNWEGRLSSLKQRLGVKRRVAFQSSHQTHVPLTFGWLKPVVLLPTSLLTQLSPEQIEMIVSHELAHIRRHDYLWSLGQSVAEVILFYHPAYWFIARVLEREREFACDQMTVETTQQPETYARTLLSIASTKATPLGLAASGRRDLSVRIRRIVTPVNGGGSVSLLPTLMLAGVLGLASVAFALQLQPLDPDETGEKQNRSHSKRAIKAYESSSEAIERIISTSKSNNSNLIPHANVPNKRYDRDMPLDERLNHYGGKIGFDYSSPTVLYLVDGRVRNPKSIKQSEVVDVEIYHDLEQANVKEIDVSGYEAIVKAYTEKGSSKGAALSPIHGPDWGVYGRKNYGPSYEERIDQVLDGLSDTTSLGLDEIYDSTITIDQRLNRMSLDLENSTAFTKSGLPPSSVDYASSEVLYLVDGRIQNPTSIRMSEISVTSISYQPERAGVEGIDVSRYKAIVKARTKGDMDKPNRQSIPDQADRWLYIVNGQVQTIRPAFLDQDHMKDQWETHVVSETEEWIKPYLTAAQRQSLSDGTYDGVLLVTDKKLLDQSLKRSNPWQPYPGQIKKKRDGGVNSILPSTERWLYIVNGEMQTNRPVFLNQHHQADGWETRYVPATGQISEYLTERQRARVFSGQYTDILIITSEDYQPRHVVYGTVVKREKGYLVPRITVRVKGKDISTATNEYGDYRLITPHRLDTIEFLFDGDVIEEIPLAGRQKVDLTASIDRALIEKQIRERKINQASQPSAGQWLYILDGQVQTTRPALLDQENWQNQWETRVFPDVGPRIEGYLTEEQYAQVGENEYTGILFIMSKEYVANQQGYYLIHGTVIEMQSERPIPDVKVRIKGKDISAKTNANGHYQMAATSMHDTVEFLLDYYVAKVPIDGRRDVSLITTGKSSDRVQKLIRNTEQKLQSKKSDDSILLQDSGATSSLFVIDGVPMHEKAVKNMNLDPQDIQVIEISGKDAAQELPKEWKLEENDNIILVKEQGLPKKWKVAGYDNVILIKTKKGSATNGEASSFKEEPLTQDSTDANFLIFVDEVPQYNKIWKDLNLNIDQNVESLEVLVSRDGTYRYYKTTEDPEMSKGTRGVEMQSMKTPKAISKEQQKKWLAEGYEKIVFVKTKKGSTDNRATKSPKEKSQTQDSATENTLVLVDGVPQYHKTLDEVDQVLKQNPMYAHYTLTSHGADSSRVILNALRAKGYDKVISIDSWTYLKKSGRIASARLEKYLQVFPNPTQDWFTLQFFVGEALPVTITVLDDQGQPITTLIDQTYPAGSHKVNWDASDQGPGVYFVQWTVGEQRVTRKVVIAP